MTSKKDIIIFSIAGSDCSGGAGIQADLKTIEALGAYGASAITAITVQNTLGVHDIYYAPAEAVSSQMDVVMSDLKPDAIKIGMTGRADIISAIANMIQCYQNAQNIKTIVYENQVNLNKIVLDPVMVSSSGKELMDKKAFTAICKELIPKVSLVTPNLHEASKLVGWEISTIDEMKKAAQELYERFGCAFLIKGGHLGGNDMCDVLCHCNEEDTNGLEIETFEHAKIDSINLHGTGCTLSSAIATFWGQGHSLSESVRLGKLYTAQAIEAAKDRMIGSGNGPLWHKLK